MFQYKNINGTFWSEEWISIKLVVLAHVQPVPHIDNILAQLPRLDTRNRASWNHVQRKGEERGAEVRKFMREGDSVKLHTAHKVVHCFATNPYSLGFFDILNKNHPGCMNKTAVLTLLRYPNPQKIFAKLKPQRNSSISKSQASTLVQGSWCYSEVKSNRFRILEPWEMKIICRFSWEWKQFRDITKSLIGPVLLAGSSVFIWECWATV